MTFAQWDFLADAVNPVLLLIFIACSVGKHSSSRRISAFLARSGVAILITWLLAHLDRWVPVLRDQVGFPSGHMAFYLTVATSFWLLDQRSLRFTLPLGLLYGWLIVFLDYHSWWDLLTAFLLAVPITLICHRMARRESSDI